MKITMTFKLEPELKKALNDNAKKLGISKSSLLRIALIEKLNKIQREK